MSNALVLPFDQKTRIRVLRGLFVLLFPVLLFAKPIELEPEWVFEILETVGVFFVIFGVLGRFWSILYIGGHKNFQVIDDGPYSICRHPLYLFSTIGVIGLGLMLGSLVLAVTLGTLTFLVLSFTASREEQFLRAQFKTDYDTYAARVPRIFPRLRGFRSASEITVSVPQLKTNFFDALVFLSFIPLAELMEWVKESDLVWSFPVV